MAWFRKNIPGIAFTFIIALIAALLGTMIPIIGGPVLGIVLGILTGNTLGKPSWSASGVKFTSKRILKLAIIVLGAGLSLTQVWKTGVESLTVMAFTLTFAFLAAYGFGRLMKIPMKLTSLIGVGTAICGGSAIAAISPIIEAEEKDVAYSISTIFFFNIIAVLIFPPLGHLLGFSDKAFGLWAGTAVNDTSSVVAAGYAFSNAAGAFATIVKLTRTTMIIPISLIFAVATAISRKKKKAASNAADNTADVAADNAANNTSINYSFRNIFPWFILGFLTTSLMNTMGLFRWDSAHFLSEAGKFLIIMALTAIGLGADIKKMLKTGIKPLLLGMTVWFVVAAVSIIAQLITGQI